MAAKTNAARLLDKANLSYRLVEYKVDENDLSAAHLAAEADLDIDQVFKTLVLRGDKGGYFVCVIPGGDELDLKKAAKASGNKSCAMIPLKDLRTVTGYIRGGCSPVGMKKAYPVYIHESAFAFSDVYVNAGQRGLQFNLAPGDLLTATRGTRAWLTTRPAPSEPE